MIEINGKHLCENCFSESEGAFCGCCGYNPSVTVSDPTMLAPGSVLLGKYIVGKVIGKGGFGITYLAYDISMGKRVAIKEYFPYGVALRTAGSSTVSVSTMENANAFKLGAEKFYDEAKLVSRFNGNPNVVGVYEFFYENNTVYFVMEYLQGHTLKEHINNNGTLSAAQALFLIENVSNALMAAHSSAVLHRDISPDNIILCDNGDIKLIDFGAARQVVAEHSQSFSVILKPGFAPLEQYQKKGNQGPWTDIYSMGTTIYFAMTGDIPEDPMSRLDDDAAFSSNQFNVDPELWNIIFKATQLKIEDRYADIFQLKNDLSKISYKSEPIIIPKEQPPEQKPEFPTAVPFGVTQSAPDVSQTNSQPVGAGAPASANLAPTAYIQPTQNGQPAQPMKRKDKVIIIGTACGLAVCIVAAVILAIILRSPDSIPASDNVGNNTYSNNGGNDPVSTDPPSYTRTSDTEPPASSAPRVKIPSGRAYYETLGNGYDLLYEEIYDGVLNHRSEIIIPKEYNFSYTKDEVDIVYYEVLFENPQFCYVYEAEVDSAVSVLKPHYIAETPAEELEKAADKLLSTIHTSDKTEALIEVHDWLYKNVTLVDRYTDYSTSAHSAIVNKYADDFGIAKAFCYCAQQLGFDCFVVDGSFCGEGRSWNRIFIDDVWYNVDVYGDMTAVSYVTSANIGDNGEYFHSCFLTNDVFIEASGYVLNSEYYYFLGNGYEANSDCANNYFEEILGYTFNYTVDAAYDHIVNFTVKRYNDKGSRETYYYISPFIIDELVKKWKRSFIADLRENGVSCTDIIAEYSADSDFHVTITVL